MPDAFSDTVGLCTGAYRRRAERACRKAINLAPPHTGYRRRLLTLVRGWVRASQDAAPLADLPALACYAGGGYPDQAAPIGAAWWLMRLAAKLLDDAEDGDAGERPAELVNLATGLIFAAQLSLDELESWGLSSGEVGRIGRELSLAGLRACTGQHADLLGAERIDTIEPDSWLTIATSKSGGPLGWATWAGATVAGVSPAVADHYREYGAQLGVLLQVADDYDATWRPDAPSDATMSRLSLAGAYGLLVAEGEDRERLEDRLARSRQGDAAAGAEVGRLLTDLGAKVFLLLAGRSARDRAERALAEAGCQGAGAAPLLDLVHRVFPALEHFEG